MWQTNGINNKHTVHRTPPPYHDSINNVSLNETKKKHSIQKAAIKNVGPRIRLGTGEEKKTSRYNSERIVKRKKKNTESKKKGKTEPFFVLFLSFVLYFGKLVTGWMDSFFFLFERFSIRWNGKEPKFFFSIFHFRFWCREKKKWKKRVYLWATRSLWCGA